MSDRDILNELIRDYVRSVQTSNVQRFEEILADDFLCSLPDGSLVDRKTFLEQTARPITISNLVAQDVDIRLMGDVAVIHARTTYTAADGGAGAGRSTDVWARRDGRWLVVVNDSFPTDWMHGWKFINFGPDGKLYASVGAPCNICDREAVGSLSDAQMAETIRMFGQEGVLQTSLLLVVGDMHEHLGQAIAYARMNEVVPPWTARQSQ